jgi:D-alanyl-D-alanine carboxypeptidase
MRIAFLVSSLLAGATVVALAAPPAAAAATDPSPSTRLQQELTAVIAAGATGVTARVQDGRHEIAAASGAAELGLPRPVPVNGRFRAGSVTKSLIGTVVLQLVAEHRLGLGDTLDDRLPGYLPPGSGITVRELLNHSSGIQDVLSTFPRPGTPEFLALRNQTWTPEQLIARVADKPLLFVPGQRARYSNTNYVLLSLIVERITGRAYSAVIEDRIVEPLRLNHTGFPRDRSIHGPHAHGYMPVREADGTTSIVDVTTFDPSIMWGGGDLISTTRDLNRFFDALLGGELLPPGLMTELKRTDEGSSYGLGVIAHPLSCGITAWGKDGDAPGYSTWSFSSPDGRKRITVSVTWGAGDPDRAVDALLDAELCP